MELGPQVATVCDCDLSTVGGVVKNLHYNRLVCSTLVNSALQCVDNLLDYFQWRQGWDNMCGDGWDEDRQWRWGKDGDNFTDHGEDEVVSMFRHFKRPSLEHNITKI